MSERAAVVLLSGGLDSYTAAALLKADGFRLYALSIRYGQRHARELESARRVASSLGVKAHLELSVDLAQAGNIARIPADERAFRWQLNEDAMATEKLSEGIRLFAADSVKLEKLVAEIAG